MNKTIINDLKPNQLYNITVYELFDGVIVDNSSITIQVKTSEDGMLVSNIN